MARVPEPGDVVQERHVDAVVDADSRAASADGAGHEEHVCGLVTADDGTFTLAFQLNPAATWSDGTPITSGDVWFTWRAALDTTGTLSTPGYDLITDIDHSDPHTAVITFSEPYAPWQTLFDLVLPAHELGPDTDIADQWNLDPGDDTGCPRDRFVDRRSHRDRAGVPVPGNGPAVP